MRLISQLFVLVVALIAQPTGGSSSLAALLTENT
jgi:hypothetical protein